MMKVAQATGFKDFFYNIALFTERIFFKYGVHRFMIISITLVHFLYCILFFVTGYSLMAYINCGSVFYYLYAFYLVKNNKNRNAFMLTVAEVFFHAVFASNLFGGKSLFVLPILGVYVYQFLAFKSILTNIFIAIFGMVAVVFSFYCEPSVPISNDTLLLFMCINSFVVGICMCFLGFLFSFQDDNMEEIKKKYYNDWLTNLNNRKYVEEKMFKELVELDTCSIGICDIDDFKHINDTYGHDVGDVVLKEVANILKQQAKNFDCDVARWGGEEFILRLDNTNQIIAQHFFESIRYAVASKYIPEINGNITLTIGVCYAKTPDTYQVSNYFKLADELLYKGKKTGKNQVVVKGYKVA